MDTQAPAAAGTTATMQSLCSSNANQMPSMPTSLANFLPSQIQSIAPNPDIKIELENADLWRRFHNHTTEMIVTKSGRRMFPTLRYKITGLEPSATYAILLELSAADDCRYKFQNGRWIVAGRAEPILSAHCQRSRMYPHPDSPAPGRIWMRQTLSFHRIKLTNNVLDPQGHVLLNSMHKYQPRVYVMRLHDYFPSVPQLVATCAFPETQFIAVTAYQNDKVIQLKIDHNPFAKGFRDNGIQMERKRPMMDGYEQQQEDMRRARERWAHEMTAANKRACLPSPSTSAASSTPTVHLPSPSVSKQQSAHSSPPNTTTSRSVFTSALMLASPSSNSTSTRSGSSASNLSTSSPKQQLQSTNATVSSGIDNTPTELSSPIKMPFIPPTAFMPPMFHPLLHPSQWLAAANAQRNTAAAAVAQQTTAPPNPQAAFYAMLMHSMGLQA